MTQEQEFEFRARAEAEALHDKAQAIANPSFMDQAASFAKQHGRELATGLGAGLGGISGGAFGAMAGGIGAIPGGVAGSALGAGTGGQLYDIAEHYLGGTPTAPTVQRMTQLGKDVGFGATAEIGGQVAGQVAGHLINAGIGALKYGTEAPAAAQAIKAKAIALLLEKRNAAVQSETLAKVKTQNSNINSNRLIDEQQTAMAKATPAPFSEGQVTTLDERGQPVQDAIANAKSDIIKARSNDRKILQEPVDNVVKNKELSGDYISDTPKSQTLLNNSKNALNPSLTESPTATSLPTPEEASVHKMVVNALEDRQVEVPNTYIGSPEASNAKITSVKEKNPITGDIETKNYRVFKTQYEALDNLRRRFGDAFHGKDATGFEGVPESLIKDIYGKLREIQKDYVGEDLYNPLQESYANYTKQLAPYNETQIGKSISGTQGSTEIPNLTASQVPGSILSKGAGGFKQVGDLGGNSTKALADEVNTQFYNPKTNAPRTSQEVSDLVHNTPLGSAINGNPVIKSAVNRHLMQLQDAEMAGVRATEIDDSLKGLATERETLAQTAVKQRELANSLQIKAQSLDSIKEPSAVLNAAKTIIDNHSSSPEVHADLMNQLQQAYKLNKEAGVRSFIKTWVARGALGAIGLGGTGAILHKVGSVLGE